jgi:hypothetical protein
MVRADSFKQTLLNVFKHVVIFGHKTAKFPNSVQLESNSLLAGISHSHFDIDILLISIQHIKVWDLQSFEHLCVLAEKAALCN